jgi:hypothetical protein
MVSLSEFGTSVLLNVIVKNRVPKAQVIKVNNPHPSLKGREP